MHEIALVEDVFRIILGVAAENRISRVDRVDVSIGEYLMVKPSLFRFAFEAAKKSTIASKAILVLEIRPVELKCTCCDNSFMPGKDRYDCPRCGSGALEIINGRNLIVKSIEGE